MNRVQVPQFIPLDTAGRPVASGYIYVGVPDTDPTVLANQKTLYIQQENGTITSVSQPIRTNAGGVPVYNGDPVTLLIDGDYSLRINNSSGSQVYYIPNVSYDDTFEPGNTYYPSSSATDQGVTGSNNTIKYYVDTIGTSKKATIFLKHDSGNAQTPYTFTTAETFPANIIIEFEPGAYITGTIAFSGSPDLQIKALPGQQIFSSTATITFGIGGTVYPEWIYPGTGNWETAIQWASSCKTTGTNKVVLTQATYNIGAYISLDDDVILTGNHSTLYVVSGTNATIIYSSGKSNVEIYGLTFDGNSSNNINELWPTKRDAAIIGAGGCENWNVHDNTFKNFLYGITTSGADATKCQIRNNILINCNMGIDTYGNGHSITNNMIYGGTNGGYGILVESANGFAGFDETEPDDSDWTGYLTGLLAIDNIVTNNVIRGEGTMLIGIYIDNTVASCIVSQNTVSNCLAKGIAVSTDEYIKQLQITNNNVRNIGEPGTYDSAEGIEVGNGKTALTSLLDVIVSGNIVSHTTGSGIKVDYGDRFIVSGNICSYSTVAGNGILLFHCDGGQIIGNFTNNNLFYGILSDYGRNLIISGNRSKKEGMASIYLSHAVGNNSIRLGRNYSEETIKAVDGVVSTTVTEWTPQYFQSADIPTAGTFEQGAVVFHSDKTTGQDAGWTCMTSGTFSSATDDTGDTDGSTGVITGMTDTSDFYLGEYVSVSAGFASTGPYKIIALTATTMTVNANSNSAQSNITVATVDPTFEAFK